MTNLCVLNRFDVNQGTILPIQTLNGLQASYASKSCGTKPVGVCQYAIWKGDGWCDDGNNNAGCDYDGGDCCGANVRKNYCKFCQCLDPNFG